MPDLTRTPRLDAGHAIAVIEAATGVRLTVTGPAPGGEVGAAYVRWPDGRDSVLNIGQPRVAPLLTAARAAGVPAPEYQLSVRDGDVTFLVQSRLPGAPPATIDHQFVQRMLAVNERLAGLLASHEGSTSLPLYLLADGPGFCLHDSLAHYDRRTSRLLAWIHDVGTDVNSASGEDLVHVDFHTANVLVDSTGAISGVVDWDGAARGDGRLDLVTLRFDLARRAPELLDWFDRVLVERVPVERLRAYWAHMSLRQVDWSIRHHSPAIVDFWVEVATRNSLALDAQTDIGFPRME